MRLMNCGDERLSRPSMGSWITYGMGTENANLPGFIAMCPGLPVADVANWKSAFLPGVYQGTYIDTRKSRVEDLIENIRNTAVTRSDQRRQLDLLGDLNRMHQKPRAEDDALEARIASFELAYRMQMAATDAFDVSREPAVGARRLRPRRPGAAAPDRPPADRARRPVRPALSRRRPALGRPRPHRREPPHPRRPVRSRHRGAC